MFGLFGTKKPEQPAKPVQPYVPPGMPIEVTLPNLGVPIPAPPSLMLPPELQPPQNRPPVPQPPMIRPPAQPPQEAKPAVTTAPSPFPPPRPSNLQLGGSTEEKPTPPTTGTPAGPGYEYFQTTDDMGRLLYSTRPKGHAGAMPGQGDAAPQFQNAGTGMSYDQAQQSIGAGKGVMDFFNSLRGGAGAPPGATGISVPPGAQGPMPNGQTIEEAQMAEQARAQMAPPMPDISGQMAPPMPDTRGQMAPGAFTNPLVPQAGSPVANFLKLIGIGGF